MNPLKSDENRLVATIDAVLGFLISTTVRIYSRILGRQAPTPEVGVEVAPEVKKKRRTIGVVAVVVIVGSIGSTFLNQGDPVPPRADPGRLVALGDALGKEAASLLGGKGGMVLLVLDMPGGPGCDDGPEVRAFKKFIATQPEIRILGIEKMPAGDFMRIGPGNGFPPTLLFSAMEKHPHAAAIVSFVGAPLLSDEDAERLDPNGPKIMTASDASAPLTLMKLIEQRVVSLAIVRQRAPAPGSGETPGPGGNVFKQNYQVLTPDAPQ